MTTKPSLYWVEPSEIALLVQRVREGGGGSPVIRAPAPRVPPTAASMAPTASIETFPAQGPTAPAPGPSPSPSPTQTRGALPSEPPAALAPASTDLDDMPPFEPASGSLEIRLQALLAWLGQGVDFHHAFVVDQDGLALVHESSAPLELIAASAEVSSTWNSLRQRFDLAERCVFESKLHDGKSLYLVTVTTEWGELSLGWVVEEHVGRQKINSIYQCFQNLLVEN